MKTQILKAVDLCKSFANNGGQNHVLDMINLEIYKGDFTVIMGSSGAGKSTLLYTLSGMDTATNGKIYYKDKELNSYAEKQMADIRAKEFGFIFQQMHLISNLTLLENAAVVGYLGQKKSTKEVRERALALLTQTHVEHAKDRLPSQVSGGEAQRAAIARAMMNEPEIIFADEPTGALNMSAAGEVMDEFERLNSAGTTILMVTHDSRVAARCGRILYLLDGKIRGELELSDQKKQTDMERMKCVEAWLGKMGW